MSKKFSDISAVCACADSILWRAFKYSLQPEACKIVEGKLLFPTYRTELLRVSEQEARFAFVEALLRSPFRYSVEVPTSKRYQFTGKSSISAQTDLVIQDITGKHVCNVEFKAKGVSQGAKKHFAIFKDLQKLLREPHWGLWFHLFGAVTNATINDFLRVLAMEIKKVRDEYANDIESPGMMIHICVLEQKFSIHKEFSWADFDKDFEKEIEASFHVEHKVSRIDLVNYIEENGWIFNRHK